MNKELEEARKNILRGNDIESAMIILKASILEGYVFYGGRVNIVKVATRQILDYLDIKLKENK